MKKLGLQVLVHVSSAALVSRGSSLDFGIMSSYFTEETVTHFFSPSSLLSVCLEPPSYPNILPRPQL